MSDETKPDLPVTTEEVEKAELDITNEDAASTKLDIVADLISSLNLPIWIARNASKAFRQLCSAAAEWPSAIFKGKAAERDAITDANIKITEEVTKKIVHQIEVPTEYAQLAVAKNIQKIIGEQINLDKTIAIAANELKEIGPANSTDPDTSETDKKIAAESTNQTEDQIEEKTISDVWLNIFETEARPRSTEDAQLLFGRILAGEIKNPGSYSIKSVKTLGELSENAAILFKRLCSACVVMEFPATKKVPDMRVSSRKDGYGQNIVDIRVPSLGGNPELDELSEYGLGFQALNILNEYGLIISAYNSSFEYNLLVDNKSWFPILELLHQEQRWILLPSGERDKIQGLKWRGIELSQVGRELFHIVDQNPMPEYTNALKTFLTGQNLTMTEA